MNTAAANAGYCMGGGPTLLMSMPSMQKGKAKTWVVEPECAEPECAGAKGVEPECVVLSR